MVEEQDIYRKLGIPAKAVRRAMLDSEKLSIDNRQFFAEHRFFSTKELCKMFDISKKEVKQSRLFYKIPPVKMGKSLKAIFVYIGDDGGYVPKDELGYSNILEKGKK